jgi:hypothetical protein
MSTLAAFKRKYELVSVSEGGIRTLKAHLKIEGRV